MLFHSVLKVILIILVAVLVRKFLHMFMIDKYTAMTTQDATNCPLEYPSFNFRPEFTDKPSECQVSDVEKPQEGTGVAEPAYPDVNEFPSEYCEKPDVSTVVYDAQPHSTERDFTEIDFDITSSGVLQDDNRCIKKGGLGRPVYENEKGFTGLVDFNTRFECKDCKY